MKREREMGEKGGGEEKKEREGEGGGEEKKEREGEGESNVYILCSFCHNVSRKGGSSEETNSGMETVKIHIKTIE